MAILIFAFKLAFFDIFKLVRFMGTAIVDIAEVVEVNEGFQTAQKRKRRRVTSSSSSSVTEDWQKNKKRSL